MDQEGWRELAEDERSAVREARAEAYDDWFEPDYSDVFDPDEEPGYDYDEPSEEL